MTSIRRGQDFSPDSGREASRPSDTVVDARTDQRWVQAVEMLVAREEWDELWRLALKAPPIWTIRILKFLNKQQWQPDADSQLGFFRQLKIYAAACNEYDLPGPESRSPLTLQLDLAQTRTQGKRDTKNSLVTSARVTADGEFLFVLDDKGAAIEIRRAFDLSPVERIRTDSINGHQYATLAFAISTYGDQLAVLVFEAKTRKSKIQIYALTDGEVVSEKSIEFVSANLGRQVPRLAFSGDGTCIALYSAFNQSTIWNVGNGDLITQFENKSSDRSDEFQPSPYVVSSESTAQDWSRYGRWAMSESVARQFALSTDGSSVAASRKLRLLVWRRLQDKNFLSVDRPSDGPMAFSVAGNRLVTVCSDSVVCYEIGSSEMINITYCSDPTLRFALSHDAEILAMSMSHGARILIWHLPDGRNLGTLYGLGRDYLVDLKVTDGGSVIAVTRGGVVQIWESDGNGNAWPWSSELVQITHQSVDASSVQVLRQAQEMRRRGWLSIQESNLLDLALALMQNRLNLDIEVEWDSTLPGDVFDIEIE